MQRIVRTVLAGFAIALIHPHLTSATEPWTDRTLPVTEGLMLWLDASSQERASESRGIASAGPGGPVAVWFDGSGRKRHASQRSRDAWPTRVGQGEKAAVRFDGKDDRLELFGEELGLELGTVFVLAAPGSNPGGFRALLAANETGRRDFETGFTIDLGPDPTARFESLNVEGRGFVGARDLLEDSLAPASFHVIEVVFGDESSGVVLRIDGRLQGRRERGKGKLRLDELTIGARYYSLDAAPCHARGFFDGSIAEILLYNRVLSAAETQAVRDHLARKRAALDGVGGSLADASIRPRRRVLEPPPVQFLVPGFATRELPVRLANINNVKYRADGTLVALAYDGDIFLLSDRDGDGLEEHVETFWENRGRLRAPIGLALTPPGYRLGAGAFVPSKGKLSLIVDTDGDDRADREIVVAEGWKESDHGVDALGVALATDGRVFFSLGTASYTNPYLLDARGVAHYDPKGERGTILRVEPDFRSRIAIATGLRYAVALAFNREGDLFATDQEGATWLGNGNPFDELLQIEPGRHYGFPPRHSRYLPGVIDEPPVFEFSPQHQSTCGLNFNMPARGGRAFGPSWWEGDALVCGYSRGKVFRTKLVKTTAGYVAQSAILAVLDRLAVDACVSPGSSLIIAAHSGGPDWGSGPGGLGRLYKVEHVAPGLPQPVATWAESPREVFVAFDRPLETELVREFARGIAIESGRSVTAGERFETLRPGYAVVKEQEAEPRRSVTVHSTRVSPDMRTLVLATDPHREAVQYAIRLPGPGEPARRAEVKGVLPQVDEIDLAYGLEGAQAEWGSLEGEGAWRGWLPHLDLAAARGFTAGSAEHDRLWPLLSRPGTLTLRALLDLRHLLRPEVQPGPLVEDRLPAESASLVFEASGPLSVRTPSGRVVSKPEAGRSAGDHRLEVDLGSDLAVPFPIEVELRTRATVSPRLSLSFHTAEDPRPRALPSGKVLLPWAGRVTGDPSASGRESLAGSGVGDWARGRDLFFGGEARCSDCHTVRGLGGAIGPDLSHLGQRDFESVLRDIREPSFAIHPDYLSYTLALGDGRVLAGTVRTEGDKLVVGDSRGRLTTIDRSEVEEIRPSPDSTMPKGLVEALGPERVRDLLAFLIEPELQPAPIHRDGLPPPRARAELESVLGPPRPSARAPRALRVVLVSGPKDHGLDEHDYPLWRSRWASLLSHAEGVTVSTAEGWPGALDLDSADVLVWYSANPAWSAEKGNALDAYLERGGGLVALHYAINGRNAPEALARRLGLAWRDGHSRYRHGPFDLAFAATAHPITSGFRGLHLVDESYWDLIGDPAGVEVLATTIEEGRPRPMFWTRTQGKGRVFCSVPGHYSWTFDDPLFRVLILRGIAWSAGESADRFRELSTPGARIDRE